MVIKPAFCICKKKTQISCTLTTQVISAFVFATIVQYLYSLIQTFKLERSVQPSCWTWPEPPRTDFRKMRFIMKLRKTNEFSDGLYIFKVAVSLSRLLYSVPGTFRPGTSWTGQFGPFFQYGTPRAIFWEGSAYQ